MVSSPAYAKHPDHTIAVTPYGGRVTVRFGGVVVAETERALVLKEADYPAAFYIPFADCAAGHFEKSDHATVCPFKGTATYWTLTAGGARAENAVWGYETPYDQVASIAGHVAFYPDKVEIAAG